MLQESKGTKILLAIILGGAIAVVIMCLLFKAGVVQTDLLTTEFKLRGNSLEELADSVIDEIINDDMKEYDKYKVLHDWLINYAHYDWENVNTSSSSMHNGTVVLSAGQGVCDGYAYAYQALCKSAGLYCGVVIGNTGDAYADHAWNIVRVNDKFYHVDCTWDDTDNSNNKGNEQIYNYFMLSDKTMKAKGRTFESQNCISTIFENKEKPIL